MVSGRFKCVFVVVNERRREAYMRRGDDEAGSSSRQLLVTDSRDSVTVPTPQHGRRWVVVAASAGIFVPATDLTRLHATGDSTHFLIQGFPFSFPF